MQTPGVIEKLDKMDVEGNKYLREIQRNLKKKKTKMLNK